MDNIVNIIIKGILLVIIAFLLYWMIRKWTQDKQLAGSGLAGQERAQTRASKKEILEHIKKQYPGLGDMMIWVNARMMENKKHHNMEIVLESEWCCEDKTGKADAPIKARPAKVVFTCKGKTEAYAIHWKSETDFLGPESTKLVAWGIMQSAQMLVPYRFYRLEVKRSRRTFHVDNGVPVNWEDDTAVLENFILNIS